MTDPNACEVNKAPRARRVVDRSWFPACGITRVHVDYSDSPSLMATGFGNALVEANLDCSVPFLFRREGSPVQLVYVGRDEDDASLVVKPLDRGVLKSMLTEVGQIMVGGKPWRKDIPDTIVTQLLTRTVTDSRVPWLKSVVTSPTLTGDGWLEGTSYDAQTGILARVEEEAGWRDLPILTTESDLITARALVLDLFNEVKLARTKDSVSVATLVSAMVGIVARPLFSNVPLQVFASGAFGPGKTTMGEAIFTVCLADGEWSMVAAADFDDSPAEVNKRIGDALTKGLRGLLIDDPAEGIPLNNSDLATLLTSGYADLRVFGRLGGAGASIRVYSNQTVVLCANNPNLSERLWTRAVATQFEAGVPDARQIKWQRPKFLDYVRSTRHEYNWAIRVLVDQAYQMLRSPATRARWDAWYMGLKEKPVRGNYSEWFLYCAAVAEQLGVEPNDFLSDQERREAAADPEAEHRDWIVTRMRTMGAPDAMLRAGEMLTIDDDCPFDNAQQLGMYLKDRARGKWGADDGGVMWRIEPDTRLFSGKQPWTLKQ